MLPLKGALGVLQGHFGCRALQGLYGAIRVLPGHLRLRDFQNVPSRGGPYYKDYRILGSISQRVHVGIWYILKAQRGSHMPTLRPKYLANSYMDPLGLESPHFRNQPKRHRLHNREKRNFAVHGFQDQDS